MDLTNFVMADIVIAVVLLLAVLLGSCKGLVKSLAGVVIVATSFIGASFIADAMADPVAQWMGPLLQEHIHQKLAPQESQSAETMLELFHFDGSQLEQMAQQVLDTVSETGQSLISAVTGTITHSIAYAAVYVVAFLVLLLVCWLLMKPVCLMVKLPGLRTLDRLGGGALGLIWGALLVFLVVWAMLRFDWVLTEEMVENSYLLHFFATNSPLSLLTKL